MIKNIQLLDYKPCEAAKCIYFVDVFLVLIL